MNLIENLTAKIRELFTTNSEAQTAALASACIAEIRSQAGLAQWIASLGALSARERLAMLTRAASVFRGEWATFGLADTLARLADKPALYRAVLRELTRTRDVITPFPQKPTHPLAQAA